MPGYGFGYGIRRFEYWPATYSPPGTVVIITDGGDYLITDGGDWIIKGP